MILDVTYKCRRKQTKVVPMKPESIRGVIKNYIVYDEANPSEAFSEKCSECKFSEPGVRITHGPAGANVLLCKITLDSVREQDTDDETN
jgi:hypothetical protein